jgi:hypothetical protein
VGVNDFVLDEAAGMGGVFQAVALRAGHNVVDQRGKPQMSSVALQATLSVPCTERAGFCCRPENPHSINGK